jgi:hypothetical protein
MKVNIKVYDSLIILRKNAKYILNLKSNKFALVTPYTLCIYYDLFNCKQIIYNCIRLLLYYVNIMAKQWI